MWGGVTTVKCGGSGGGGCSSLVMNRVGVSVV